MRREPNGCLTLTDWGALRKPFIRKRSDDSVKQPGSCRPQPQGRSHGPCPILRVSAAGPKLSLRLRVGRQMAETPLPPRGSGGCCGRRHRFCAVSPALVGGGREPGGERLARLALLWFFVLRTTAGAAECGTKWGLSLLQRTGSMCQGMLRCQDIRLRSDSAAPPQLQRIAQQAGQQQRAAQIPAGQATGRREHPPQPFHRDLLHPDRRPLLMTA